MRAKLLASAPVLRCVHCMQIIAKNRLATPEEVEDVRHEVQIMHHLEGHPNIVRLLNVYEDKQYVFLVQEHCAGE